MLGCDECDSVGESDGFSVGSLEGICVGDTDRDGSTEW